MRRNFIKLIRRNFFPTRISLSLFICCLAILNNSEADAQTAEPPKYSVLITELYADPDLISSLPVSEFIEIKNVTGSLISLKGWKLADATSSGTITSNIVLKPDSFLIICTPSALNAFSRFGTAIGLSGFPSLNNDEDELSLYAASGKLIHYVHYNDDWYANDVKKTGGWSLEMIDPANPCSGSSNWRASEDSRGGSPGSRNSVTASNPDLSAPVLLKTYVTDSMNLVLMFDEGVDSTLAANVTHYTVIGSLGHIVQALPVGPAFVQVKLQLDKPLKPDIVEELLVSGIADCAGNVIAAGSRVKYGLPSPPAINDIIINELLFNPAGAGYDYVELYNRSKKIIDARKLLVGSRSNTGSILKPIAISKDERFIFPGEYIIVTENKEWLGQNYTVKDASAVSVISDLPSLPDDDGNLVVLNSQGSIIDEINYSYKWHYALINNKDGVALERIDPEQPTNEKMNWISAASGIGFGTPGYQNSQYRIDLQVSGSFTIGPKTFSPDNDGYNDVAGIHYEMAAAGYMGSITIFDASGRPVRYLVKSALLGLKGVYNWDGLNENQQSLPVGIYIVLMEVFDLKGRVKKTKAAITLARKISK